MVGRNLILRKLRICAGHRVYGHESKCSNLHGHDYTFEFWVRPKNNLDSIGRVLDFSVVKKVMAEWLDENLDHAMILFKDDPLVEWFKNKMVKCQVLIEDDDCWQCETVESPFFGQKHYVLSLNPTAENLCNVLAHKAQELLRGYDIAVTKVGCWETPNCYAEYILQE